MISVAIVGNGNVGFHLYRELIKSNDLKVAQINSREQQSLEGFDIAIIAVSDDAITEVSKHIKTPLVVHTSGTTSLKALENSTRKGVFYPLQSFSKEKTIDFSELPICIEAENGEDENILKSLASTLSSRFYTISSEQRNYLHAAAVFANNFTNHMYKLANDICLEHDVPFEVLLPLIQETAEKVASLSPEKAQTGPAKRNDQDTIKNHLHLLTDSQKEIYQLLTESIQQHGKKL